MIVSAKLIKNQLNKAWYAFGSNDTKDGTFCVDFDNFDSSTIEKSSESVHDVMAIRLIARLISEKEENKIIPEALVYCNGG